MDAASPPTDSKPRNMTDIAARKRLNLRRCLIETAQFPGVDVSACQLLDQKFADMTFNLVVAGQFKRGKSSIINALLGEPLLPTGVVPLTSIVTAIRFGTFRGAHVHHQDGREHTITLDSLNAYVTEEGNPHNAQHVSQVVVDHPSGWLAQGVRLVDTPGIGSVYQHNTDVAQQYLPQADAVLFIASVDQPLGIAEIEFLTSIREYAGKIFCLLNKTDYLEPDELTQSVAFSTSQIRSTLGEATPLFAVSAKLALQGKRESNGELLARSGFPAFEHALACFMADEQHQVWLRSAGQTLLRVLSQLRFTLELESKLLAAPQKEIDLKLAAFRHKKLDVQRSVANHQVLLEADARALLTRDIEPALTHFKSELQHRIGTAIGHWYADLTLLSSRDLRGALEAKLIAEIRAGYDEWLAREDSRLRGVFGSLCGQVWSDLQAAIDELMRHSSKLFALEFEAVPAEGGWTSESDLYYKFWYEPTSLKILAASFILVLPKSVAGRLIVKQTKVHAQELIEAQAGRIRHDLEERLKRSVHDARRQIVLTAESIVDRIEAAIDHGLAARRDSATQIVTRGAELADSIHSVSSIEARVRTLVS